MRKRLVENRAKRQGKGSWKIERKRIEKRMGTVVSKWYSTRCEGPLDEPGTSVWTVTVWGTPDEKSPGDSMS